MRFLSVLSIGLGIMAGDVFAQDFPVQVTCGDLQKGPGVKFEISPLAKIVKYTTLVNGKSNLETFAPRGGIYDRSSLAFGGNEFHNRIYIHGNYTQIVRINHYSAITIGLEKDWNSEAYKLIEFSDGHLTTGSTYDEVPVKEESHLEFVGLSCSVTGVGVSTADNFNAVFVNAASESQCKVPPQADCSKSPKRICCDCDASGQLSCS